MRMSNAEAIMWAVEKDPALRSDFCNLTILDRRPSDTRMRATAERALEAIPRLGQRVVSAPLRSIHALNRLSPDSIAPLAIERTPSSTSAGSTMTTQ